MGVGWRGTKKPSPDSCVWETVKISQALEACCDGKVDPY